MKIAIINGPNLNLLGKREKDIYGNQSFEDFLKELSNKFPQIEFDYFQSNVEGELVSAIHDFGFTHDGLIINAGAYTHTSIALRDAISGVKSPTVEVHISNVLTRENFRHDSMIGPACKGTILGFGLGSYELGVQSFLLG